MDKNKVTKSAHPSEQMVEEPGRVPVLASVVVDPPASGGTSPNAMVHGIDVDFRLHVHPHVSAADPRTGSPARAREPCEPPRVQEGLYSRRLVQSDLVGEGGRSVLLVVAFVRGLLLEAGLSNDGGGGGGNRARVVRFGVVVEGGWLVPLLVALLLLVVLFVELVRGLGGNGGPLGHRITVGTCRSRKPTITWLHDSPGVWNTSNRTVLNVITGYLFFWVIGVTRFVMLTTTQRPGPLGLHWRVCVESLQNTAIPELGLVIFSCLPLFFLLFAVFNFLIFFLPVQRHQNQ